MGREGARETASGEFPPPRTGLPPKTPRRLPHLQAEDWPPLDMIQQLMDRCARLPDVRIQESRMATPGTWALCLNDKLSQGAREAFIDDHEFCHLHPAPEGGLHLTLPAAVRRKAIATGWGEPHPAVQGGILPETVVLIYAPRDPKELDIVLRLVSISMQFAQGVQ